MTQYSHYQVEQEKIAIIAMIMVAILVLGTIAVSYEYTFAVSSPRAINSGSEHEAVAEHNRHCKGVVHP